MVINLKRVFGKYLVECNQFRSTSTNPSQCGNVGIKDQEFKHLAVAIKSLVTGRYPTHGG